MVFNHVQVTYRTFQEHSTFSWPFKNLQDVSRFPENEPLEEIFATDYQSFRTLGNDRTSILLDFLGYYSLSFRFWKLSVTNHDKSWSVVELVLWSLENSRMFAKVLGRLEILQVVEKLKMSWRMLKTFAICSMLVKSLYCFQECWSRGKINITNPFKIFSIL